MKKQSISKFFEKRSVRAALVFSLVAGISGTITYFAFPNIIKGDAGGNDIIIDDGGDSYQESSVDKFASKLTETTGIDGNLNLYNVKSKQFNSEVKDENRKNLNR